MIVRHLFLSDGHSYFGRHGQSSEPYSVQAVTEVECVAGRGLRGDRFFDYKENYKGQLTLFSAEVFTELRTALNSTTVQPSALRRNLIVEGVDLNTLIGQEFEVQGVKLLGTEECRPCYWMNEALGPGAEDWLRGRGGLRCQILSDGWIRQSSP